MPFAPTVPQVVLRQITFTKFALLEPFSYTPPRGPQRTYQVDPKIVGSTDLASVPWFLWWFVASYGRHTAAALVHDELVDTINRTHADWVFRAALKESGVRFIRRWLMWSAVSFETRFRTAFMPTNPEDIDKPRDDQRRLQRKHGWVTVAGFGLVIGQLGLSITLIARPYGFSFGGTALLSVSQWIGVALLGAWLLEWRLRGLIVVPALALLGPAIATVLITALFVWGVLELGIFRLGQGNGPRPTEFAPEWKQIAASAPTASGISSEEGSPRSP